MTLMRLKSGHKKKKQHRSEYSKKLKPANESLKNKRPSEKPKDKLNNEPIIGLVILYNKKNFNETLTPSGLGLIQALATRFLGYGKMAVLKFQRIKMERERPRQSWASMLKVVYRESVNRQPNQHQSILPQPYTMPRD